MRSEAFYESFEELNPDRWYLSDGWANGEHQSCIWLADRVSLADGMLELTLSDDDAADRDYSCAEVQTRDAFGYGTFEARMKVPQASGTTSTFFSFIGEPQGRPHDEIDFEFLGKREGALQTNFFADGQGGHEEVTVVPSAHRAFHDYAFVWEPNRIRWFVDGELVREASSEKMPDGRQKIYLSIWSTGTLTDWLGEFDYPGSPLTMQVEWVAYTPLEEPCQFPTSVVCRLDTEESPNFGQGGS